MDEVLVGDVGDVDAADSGFQPSSDVLTAATAELIPDNIWPFKSSESGAKLNQAVGGLYQISGSTHFLHSLLRSALFRYHQRRLYSVSGYSGSIMILNADHSADTWAASLRRPANEAA